MLRRLLGAVAGVIAACAPSGSASFAGGWGDVDEYVRRLANAPEYGVLIIGVQGSEDFVQFSASDASVQMDCPLVTVAQQAREAAIRTFFEARDMPIMENHGSDGARFLDVELSGDPGSLRLREMFSPMSLTRLRPTAFTSRVTAWADDRS